MNLKEITEIGMYIAGAGVIGLATNELRKKYVNWAEKNKFYDESPKFNDLEKETNYVGKKVRFNQTENFNTEANKFYDNTIKFSDLKDKKKYTGKTISF